LIEATAQAKANKLLANSLTDKVIKIQSIEAWRAGGSQVPKVGETIPFIGSVKDLK
jgi:hypothetical protein